MEPDPEGASGSTSTTVLPFVVLLSLTLVTQLASVAYTAEQTFSEILLPSVAGLLIVTAPLAWLGLRLGQQTGLGAPLLTALLARRPGAWRQFVGDATIAITLGLIVGAALWVLRIIMAPHLPPELPELGHRGAVGGLLVSISAAIGEEVWLRLGFMTIIAWLLMQLLGHGELSRRVAWTAIAVAAVCFGLIHLPQLATANAATLLGVLATILGNTLVGVTCGWLFWRRSFIAAILAHFSVDLVLHVVPALLP